MKKILLLHTFPQYDIQRQLPGSSGSWNRFKFTTDPTEPDLFGCVVYDDLLAKTKVSCPRSHTLLVTGEPPSLKTYRARYTSQFGAVLTSHESISHKRRILEHEGQPWHYALHVAEPHNKVLGYDELCLLSKPTKTKRLSVIASNKVTTEDHRQRLRFVDALKSALPGMVDVYGRGIRDMADKAEAIWDYEYHIALENDHSPHYMSEKIADPFLGWAFPFYSGGKKAETIFPACSFIRIDMYDIQRSVSVIKEAMENNEAQRHQHALFQARQVVLDQSNLFRILNQHFDSLSASDSTGTTTLIPKRNSIELFFHSALRQSKLTT